MCISTPQGPTVTICPTVFLDQQPPWISLSRLSIQRRLIILSEERPSPRVSPTLRILEIVNFPPLREARRPENAWAGMSPTNQPSIGLGSMRSWVNLAVFALDIKPAYISIFIRFNKTFIAGLQNDWYGCRFRQKEQYFAASPKAPSVI